MDNLEKARAFIEGLRGRDPELTARFVSADSYVERDPDVADGITGLKEHVGRLPGGSHLKVIRMLQDGAYAVTQAEGNLSGRNVFSSTFSGSTAA